MSSEMEASSLAHRPVVAAFGVEDDARA